MTGLPSLRHGSQRNKFPLYYLCTGYQFCSSRECRITQVLSPRHLLTVHTPRSETRLVASISDERYSNLYLSSILETSVVYIVKKGRALAQGEVGVPWKCQSSGNLQLSGEMVSSYAQPSSHLAAAHWQTASPLLDWSLVSPLGN